MLQSTWYLYLYTAIHTCGLQDEYKLERVLQSSIGFRSDLNVCIDEIMNQTSAGRHGLESDWRVVCDNSMGE